MICLLLAAHMAAAQSSAVRVLTFAQAERRGLAANTLPLYADAELGQDSGIARRVVTLLANMITQNIDTANLKGYRLFFRVYADAVGGLDYLLFSPICGVNGQTLSPFAEADIVSEIQAAIAGKRLPTLPCGRWFAHGWVGVGRH